MVDSASGTQVGKVREDDVDVYAGRGSDQEYLLDVEPGDRGWLGNPFRLEDGYSRGETVRQYRNVFEWRLDADREFREAVRDLQGKTLGCWCQRVDEDEPACHAEVVAEWADRLNQSDS